MFGANNEEGEKRERERNEDNNPGGKGEGEGGAKKRASTFGLFFPIGAWAAHELGGYNVAPREALQATEREREREPPTPVQCAVSPSPLSLPPPAHQSAL